MHFSKDGVFSSRFTLEIQKIHSVKPSPFNKVNENQHYSRLKEFEYWNYSCQVFICSVLILILVNHDFWSFECYEIGFISFIVEKFTCLFLSFPSLLCFSLYIIVIYWIVLQQKIPKNCCCCWTLRKSILS